MSDQDRRVRLGEITTKIGSGATPRGGSSVYTTSGVAFIRSQNVHDFHFDYSGLAHIDDSAAASLIGVLVKPGDVLLNITGDSVARCCLAPQDVLPARVSQHVMIVRPDPAFLDGQYLQALLAEPWMKSRLLSIAGGGATRPALTRAQVAELEVDLPPVPVQHAIAEVLRALDDKIEANSRLVESAHGLASAYGRRCVLGSDGRLTALGDVVHVCKGVSYRSVDLVPGGGWLVSLKCAGRDGSFQPEGLKPFSGPAKSMQVVHDGDVVVAQTDLTQRAEVIGRPVRIERLGRPGRLVASLDFSIVRPEKGLTREFLFALLSQPEFREHALAYCNGTTVLHMNSDAIPSYQFAMPDEIVIRDVTFVLGSLLEAADAARNESMALGNLRDSLLPRLLSGELRVRDAETLVGEVV